MCVLHPSLVAHGKASNLASFSWRRKQRVAFYHIIFGGTSGDGKLKTYEPRYAENNKIIKRDEELGLSYLSANLKFMASQNMLKVCSTKLKVILSAGYM